MKFRPKTAKSLKTLAEGEELGSNVLRVSQCGPAYSNVGGETNSVESQSICWPRPVNGSLGGGRLVLPSPFNYRDVRRTISRCRGRYPVKNAAKHIFALIHFRLRTRTSKISIFQRDGDGPMDKPCAKSLRRSPSQHASRQHRSHVRPRSRHHWALAGLALRRFGPFSACLRTSIRRHN